MTNLILDPPSGTRCAAVAVSSVTVSTVKELGWSLVDLRAERASLHPRMGKLGAVVGL